jgi:4-amino-4-deoxy-L-arabinose transferase-like glycosyltransferase
MRSVIAAAALGAALTLGYAAWLQPDWEPQLNDQRQYLALARGLVERGELTRAKPGESFIPETNRLPGYPVLIAPTCLGGCDHWRIAIGQAGLVALLVVTAAGIARRVVPRRTVAVAIAVALYLPFAYFGALALSDTPGAVLFTLGVLLWLRGVERASQPTALGAGALLGWAALMRGALLVTPFALAALLLLQDRRPWRVALATIAAAALVVLPYVAYSETSFGRPYAGNSGAVLWIGVLQGRDEASLDIVEREEVDAAREEIVALDAADRQLQPRAWLALDDSLGARARRLIAHDPVGWVARSFIRSVELWGGERPLRGGATGDIAAALGAVQLVLFAAALAGAVVLVRRRDHASLVVPLVIAYVWLTALPFQTEARYALPAEVFVLIAALAAFDRWSARRAVPSMRPRRIASQ